MNEILADSLSNIVETRNLETKQQLTKIGWASSLHDIGKIAISDSIILKPAKLTEDEFELIKSHTTKGRRAFPLWMCMMRSLRSVSTKWLMSLTKRIR